VRFASTDERRFALLDQLAFAITSGHPPVPGQGPEDLTEPRFVRADLASRLEVDEVGVRLAATLGELDRSG
jgi:hypothetical protein